LEKEQLHSQGTVVNTFASAQEPSLKPKACKRASALQRTLAKPFWPTKTK